MRVDTTMATIARLAGFALLVLLSRPGLAQDLAITNARIVVGNGETSAQGTVVVRDGLIVSVADSAMEETGIPVIDARGMTVMPGFIDTHVHTLAYAEQATDDDALAAFLAGPLPELLREMLAAGVTTALDTGAYFPAVLDVREKLETGELVGPRLRVSGPAFGAPEGHPAATICRNNPYCREHLAVPVDDPALARARVAELAEAGVDFIKAVHQAGAHLPLMDEEVIAAMAAEADARDVPFVVHGTFYSGMVRAAELGVDGFVHVPWRDQADPVESRAVFADAGIPIATTVSLHDSFVDAQGVRRTVMGGTFPPAQDGDRIRAVANARVFWDAGVTLAFGTDQQRLRPYAEAVLGEARALAEVLPTEEVISILTRNAADYLGLGGEIGTLEAGKRADMVIVAGDPLEDIGAIGDVAAVIQAGRIAFDSGILARRESQARR